MSATRARARKRTRADSDKGVRLCVDLMTSGQWISGQSHESVAAECGVAPATVKDWATSASRIIRLATEGDREDVRARMLATLDTIVSKAVGGKRPDLRAATTAIEVQAKLLGLTQERLHVTGGLGLMNSSASLEERVALAKSVVGALESQRGEPS